MYTIKFWLHLGVERIHFCQQWLLNIFNGLVDMSTNKRKHLDNELVKFPLRVP